MIPTCISDDIEAAKAVNRRTLASYLQLPNYRNYWKECGYVEEMAAVERAIMGMQSAIDAAIARLTEPLDRIGCAVRAYLGYFDRNPECIELLMQERAQFPERKKPKYFEHREANRGAWEKLYRDLIAQGYFRDIPVQRITDTVGALVYGAMFTNYFAGRRKGLAEQAEDILDVVFNGLLTQTGKGHRRLAAAKERES